MLYGFARLAELLDRLLAAGRVEIGNRGDFRVGRFIDPAGDGTAAASGADQRHADAVVGARHSRRRQKSGRSGSGPQELAAFHGKPILADSSRRSVFPAVCLPSDLLSDTAGRNQHRGHKAKRSSVGRRRADRRSAAGVVTDLPHRPSSLRFLTLPEHPRRGIHSSSRSALASAGSRRTQPASSSRIIVFSKTTNSWGARSIVPQLPSPRPRRSRRRQTSRPA